MHASGATALLNSQRGIGIQIVFASRIPPRPLRGFGALRLGWPRCSHAWKVSSSAGRLGGARGAFGWSEGALGRSRGALGALPGALGVL